MSEKEGKPVVVAFHWLVALQEKAFATSGHETAWDQAAHSIRMSALKTSLARQPKSQGRWVLAGGRQLDEVSPVRRRQVAADALTKMGQACVDYFMDVGGCHFCEPRNGKHDVECPVGAYLSGTPSPAHLGGTATDDVQMAGRALTDAAVRLLDSLGEYVRQSMQLNPEWRDGIAAMRAALENPVVRTWRLENSFDGRLRNARHWAVEDDVHPTQCRCGLPLLDPVHLTSAVTLTLVD